MPGSLPTTPSLTVSVATALGSMEMRKHLRQDAAATGTAVFSLSLAGEAAVAAATAEDVAALKYVLKAFATACQAKQLKCAGARHTFVREFSYAAKHATARQKLIVHNSHISTSDSHSWLNDGLLLISYLLCGHSRLLGSRRFHYNRNKNIFWMLLKLEGTKSKVGDRGRLKIIFAYAKSWTIDVVVGPIIN
jgi:hypothetical protein